MIKMTAELLEINSQMDHLQVTDRERDFILACLEMDKVLDKKRKQVKKLGMDFDMFFDDVLPFNHIIDILDLGDKEDMVIDAITSYNDGFMGEVSFFLELDRAMGIDE
ncbi:hypothetical protein LC065_20270 (plasmid) [Halobacillus litoralis]|uniref:hypothetical protein n=1 Tax=Halobacillus litoralis TaxID=45668 RepID=UPI001CFC6B5F|nr:hypothetical protein [Halobacillus litoralis]WLR49582.1 hypothetical protein LC065_20270 [Halobacillus litoralis]